MYEIFKISGQCGLPSRLSRIKITLTSNTSRRLPPRERKFNQRAKDYVLLRKCQNLIASNFTKIYDFGNSGSLAEKFL